MFTLAISYLATSNLPWFMDLTFQVPMQYCCLQHQTLLLSPVISTTGYCFCFGSIPSFFLELFLHWSPVAYWAPNGLGSFLVSYHFAFSYCSWGSQGKNTDVACYSLLQRTTICQASPPWPARLGLPHRHGLVSLSYTRLWSNLSRLVIIFLPRSKCLLISWLQSPSAVILESKKSKSDTVSTVSPSISHEVMGPDAMIFVFWMLSFKPTFSLSSFTFIRRLLSSSSLLP